MKDDLQKTRILFLSANPVDTPHIMLSQEYNGLHDRLRIGDFRDQFELILQPGISVMDLQQVWMEYKPQIVHFSGHGSNTNALKFENSEGKSEDVPPNALSDLFRILGRSIRLVVLNACYSVPQARGISKYIDCVIGSSTAIRDDAAREFAVYFYQALGFGKSVQEAYELGRNQLYFSRVPEEQMPVLLQRDGIEPSEIFFTNKKPNGNGPPPPTNPKRFCEEVVDLKNTYDKLIYGTLDIDEFLAKLLPKLCELSDAKENRTLIGNRNADSLRLNLINISSIKADYVTTRDIGDENRARIMENQIKMVSGKVIEKLQEICSTLQS
jgi:hypothetical protein